MKSLITTMFDYTLPFLLMDMVMSTVAPQAPPRGQDPPRGQGLGTRLTLLLVRKFFCCPAAVSLQLIITIKQHENIGKLFYGSSRTLTSMKQKQQKNSVFGYQNKI